MTLEKCKKFFTFQTNKLNKQFIDRFILSEEKKVLPLKQHLYVY